MASSTTSAGSADKRTAWVLLAIAALANAAGYAFGLWHSPPWFDEVVHGYTTMALTLVLALYLYGRVYTGARTHAVLLVLVIASLGVGIGAVWEVAEWAYDQWIASGDAILGKWDTITDLVYDTLGALAAGAVATAMVRGRERRERVGGPYSPTEPEPGRSPSADQVLGASRG